MACGKLKLSGSLPRHQQLPRIGQGQVGSRGGCTSREASAKGRQQRIR